MCLLNQYIGRDVGKTYTALEPGLMSLAEISLSEFLGADSIPVSEISVGVEGSM